MQAFTYMGVAFSLLTTEKVLRYYKSIYYSWYIAVAVALVVGLAITKATKPSRPKVEKKKE